MLLADQRARFEEAEWIMGRPLRHLLHQTARLQPSLFLQIKQQSTTAILRAMNPPPPCMLNQESAWNPDVISPSKGLEISYWLHWFTQTITSTSIPPIRTRRPAPYAVVMRCFKESHLDEETGLERNGAALLTDVPLAPDKGEETSTFSPLNRTQTADTKT